MTEAHEEIRLARLDAARQALEEATSIPEVKHLRSVAASVQVFYAQRAGSLDAQNKAAELKLRAERRLGELLRETLPHQPGRPKKLDHRDPISRLPDGIKSGQSKRWQTSSKLPEDQFEAYLIKGKTTGTELTSKDVLSLAQRFQREQKHARWSQRPRETSIAEQMAALIQDGKRFATFYVDPPWQYGNQATRGATDKHYPTMTTEEIAKLPVKQLAEDDAHLHLWTTNAFGFEAREIMETWGFTYKSWFVWLKPDLGMGNYWRVATECMLLGIRGNCPFRSNSIPNWLEAKATTHSAKPEIVARLIEEVSFPAYVELFGRHVRTGWTVLGNEIDKTWFDDPRVIHPVQEILLEELPRQKKKVVGRKRTRIRPEGDRT